MKARMHSNLANETLHNLRKDAIWFYFFKRKHCITVLLNGAIGITSFFSQNSLAPFATVPYVLHFILNTYLWHCSAKNDGVAIVDFFIIKILPHLLLEKRWGSTFVFF